MLALAGSLVAGKDERQKLRHDRSQILVSESCSERQRSDNLTKIAPRGELSNQLLH